MSNFRTLKMAMLLGLLRQPIRQPALASQSFLCRRVTEKLAAIAHAGVGVSKARCQYAIASKAGQTNIGLSLDTDCLAAAQVSGRVLTPVLGRAGLLLYHRGYAYHIAETRC
jgi:hypothetical protein